MRDGFCIRDRAGGLSGKVRLQFRLQANYPHLLYERFRGLVRADACYFVH